MNRSQEDRTLIATWDSRDDIREPGDRLAGARIVVVEDDFDMRTLVTSRLSEEGYDVHDAISGVDLMNVIESIEIDRWPLDGVDLIVLDHRMPGMSGLEAIGRLRAARWEVPAILITAFPDDDVRRAAAALGVPVLPKPFPMDLLANAVLLSLLSKPRGSGRHNFRVAS